MNKMIYKYELISKTNPYFIAELNSSHNGSLETAMGMIDSAKLCGCDCVKFQSWSPESLYSRSFYEKNKIAEKLFKKFSLSEDNLCELFQYCKSKNIDFTSTPYSFNEVDFLVKQQVPFIKIASMDINNFDFLEYVAKTEIPVVLSTGMATFEEITRAVNIFKKYDNKNLAILHCTSLYPTKIYDVNLNNIKFLYEKFKGYKIGFSDHTLGNDAAIAAIALGAIIIEKHFTLDKTKLGMDNNMAIEPEQMRSLVQACRNITSALGSSERILSEKELEQRKKMRRSIIANHDLDIGHIICKEDLGAKRPGDGIPIDRINTVIGRKVKKSIQADTFILEDDLI